MKNGIGNGAGEDPDIGYAGALEAVDALRGQRSRSRAWCAGPALLGTAISCPPVALVEVDRLAVLGTMVTM